MSIHIHTFNFHLRFKVRSDRAASRVSQPGMQSLPVHTGTDAEQEMLQLIGVHSKSATFCLCFEATAWAVFCQEVEKIRNPV
jgi:hypothetical protein